MSKHSPHRLHCAKGFVSLLAVIIVGAIGLSIAVALLLNGVNALRFSFSGEQSAQARALADACAEHALGIIRGQTSYTGNGSLSLGNGICTYTVSSQGAQNRTITATGTVGTLVRKVRITLDKITPDIELTSWQEVADF